MDYITTFDKITLKKITLTFGENFATKNVFDFQLKDKIMQVISVVRDFDTYNRLVKGNPFYSARTNFVAFDNRVENQGISKRYNSFLDNYDYSKSDWFLFCHEDWELK